MGYLRYRIVLLWAWLSVYASPGDPQFDTRIPCTLSGLAEAAACDDPAEAESWLNSRTVGKLPAGEEVQRIFDSLIQTCIAYNNLRGADYWLTRAEKDGIRCALPTYRRLAIAFWRVDQHDKATEWGKKYSRLSGDKEFYTLILESAMEHAAASDSANAAGAADHREEDRHFDMPSLVRDLKALDFPKVVQDLKCLDLKGFPRDCGILAVNIGVFYLSKAAFSKLRGPPPSAIPPGEEEPTINREKQEVIEGSTEPAGERRIKDTVQSIKSKASSLYSGASSQVRELDLRSKFERGIEKARNGFQGMRSSIRGGLQDVERDAITLSKKMGKSVSGFATETVPQASREIQLNLRSGIQHLETLGRGFRPTPTSGNAQSAALQATLREEMNEVQTKLQDEIKYLHDRLRGVKEHRSDSLPREVQGMLRHEMDVVRRRLQDVELIQTRVQEEIQDTQKRLSEVQRNASPNEYQSKMQEEIGHLRRTLQEIKNIALPNEIQRKAQEDMRQIRSRMQGVQQRAVPNNDEYQQVQLKLQTEIQLIRNRLRDVQLRVVQ
uniref:Uncharacterized protein n=1 Tax=Lotharella globosa TaxID=91324 RepID=A0A7S3Z9X5_9EUKA|mmetsp:Transcript_28353/g.55196  ORF Transcript_28353/g.55196 Transcript_28353/m.55196 type:complete len:552 (+) Transcript_28353:27-1682(+)